MTVLSSLPEDVGAWWRLFNALAAIVAFGWLLLDLRDHWRVLSQRRLFLTLSLGGLLAAVVVGTTRNLANGDRALPPSWPTAIVTASVLWCLIGLWVSKGDPS